MTSVSFVGRNQELAKLSGLLEKKTASLVVVYGRRRIGKSRLIEHFAKSFKTFSFVGLTPRKAISKQSQLDEFSRQLARESNRDYQRFIDWGDAFAALSEEARQGRVVIFLDEISWMALEDPDFSAKLKIAWDKYFKKNPNLILIVCGSVSAWIKKNIVNSTGFHGRISLKIYLRELKMPDCKKFWNALVKNISNVDIIKLLAVTGGVPKYLEEVNPKFSVEENIRQLAFSDSGILFNDFQNIFTDTLLRKSDIYERIVRLLSDGSVDSKEIPKKVGVDSGGYLSSVLDELTVAGFISKSSSWNFKTGKLSSVAQYRLSDNYLRFYLKYIEPNTDKILNEGFENRSISSLPGWSSIMSLQIENLVLNNRALILKRLGVMHDEIVSDNPYLQRASERRRGCQIDYLIQIKHGLIYVCEIKFTRSIIRKDVIEEVQTKIDRLAIPKNTSVRPVLIYLGALHDEVMDSGYFANIINLESLVDDD